MDKSYDIFISVIIPTYNMEEYIIECLESVYMQTYENFECIIVNDGSTDKSEVVIYDFIGHDKRFKYFYKKNEGLSAARNFGIRAAKGEYIAFLDADDKWLQNKLEFQVRLIDKLNKDNIIFCNSYIEDPAGKLYEYQGQPYKNEITDLLKSNLVNGSGSSVIVPKSVFSKIGYFDESLNSFEDLEFWFRLSCYGYIFTYLPNSFVIIRSRPLSMSKKKITMQEANLNCLKKQINTLIYFNPHFSLHSFVIALKLRIYYSRRYFIPRKYLLNYTYMFRFIILTFILVFKVFILKFRIKSSNLILSK